MQSQAKLRHSRFSATGTRNAGFCLRFCCGFASGLAVCQSGEGSHVMHQEVGHLASLLRAPRHPRLSSKPHAAGADHRAMKSNQKDTSIAQYTTGS
eukprot:304422-Rhodomonas_salina.1